MCIYVVDMYSMPAGCCNRTVGAHTQCHHNHSARAPGTLTGLDSRTVGNAATICGMLVPEPVGDPCSSDEHLQHDANATVLPVQLYCQAGHHASHTQTCHQS